MAEQFMTIDENKTEETKPRSNLESDVENTRAGLLGQESKDPYSFSVGNSYSSFGNYSALSSNRNTPELTRESIPPYPSFSFENSYNRSNMLQSIYEFEDPYSSFSGGKSYSSFDNYPAPSSNRNINPRLGHEFEDPYSFSIRNSYSSFDYYDPYYYSSFDYYDPYPNSGSSATHKNIHKNKTTEIYSIFLVKEELLEYLDKMFYRAEEVNNLKDESRINNEDAKQLAERLNRLKEILEINNIGITKAYIDLNQALAVVATNNPELYSKIITNIQELNKTLLENEELRNELVKDEETAKIILALAFSTAKDKNDYNNAAMLAQELGFGEVFNTSYDIINDEVINNNVRENNNIPNESFNSTKQSLNEITLSELNEFFSSNKATDEYYSNPYFAHFMDAIAAKLIAQGKFDLPPDTTLGLHLINSWERLDEETRNELVQMFNQVPQLRELLENPEKRINQAIEDREKIIANIENKHPEEGKIIKQLFNI